MVNTSNKKGGGQMAATQRQRKEALRLYRETDMTVEAIADRYDVTRATVYRWIDSANIQRRGPMGPRPKDEPPQPIDFEGQTRRDLAAARGAEQAEHEMLMRAIGDLTKAVTALSERVDVHTQITRDWVLGKATPGRRA